MKYTRFNENVLTEFPSKIHDYDSVTGIYFVITSEKDWKALNNDEYPERIKIGMTHSKVALDDAKIIKQINKRALQASTGTGIFYNAGYLLVPGKISSKIDDIVRKKILPRIIQILEPSYKGAFTNNDDGKTSGPRELSYHVSKKYILILFHLLYNRLYNITYPKNFTIEYSNIIADSDICDHIEKIAALSKKSINSEHTNTLIDIHTEKDTGFFDNEYYKTAFSLSTRANDKIAIVTDNKTDAYYISKLYPGHTIKIFSSASGSENIKGSILLSHTSLTKYQNKFDIVLANIPVNGNKPLYTVFDAIMKLVNRSTGRLSVLVNDSLTSSQRILIVSQNKCGTFDVNEKYIGEKSSVEVSSKLYRELAGHITSVSLDNLNTEFDQDVSKSFLSIQADFSQTRENFNFCAYGWNRTERYLSDCTLFGNTFMFNKIIRKILSAFPDTISSHIIEKTYIDNSKKQSYLISYPCFKTSPLKNKNRSACRKTYNGMKKYISDALLNTSSQEIIDSRELSISKNSRFISFDTYDYAENYKANTSLLVMKYIAAMTAQQTRPKSTEIIPYIVDKVYTDEDIASLAEFTAKEIFYMKHVVSLCVPTSALLDRMETGDKHIIPLESNPAKNWASEELY